MTRIKTFLLLFLVLPIVLPLLVFGVGGPILAFITCMCLHFAPETTTNALHSRLVMTVWEVVNKGM
jgi:glucose-6-phosphate-specific signal transduction histidine kinase